MSAIRVVNIAAGMQPDARHLNEESREIPLTLSNLDWKRVLCQDENNGRSEQRIDSRVSPRFSRQSKGATRTCKGIGFKTFA